MIIAVIPSVILNETKQPPWQPVVQLIERGGRISVKHCAATFATVEEAQKEAEVEAAWLLPA